MTLGEKIKLLRANKGITQEALAEQLNVSRSTIAKWEVDGGIPEISNLKAISKIFILSVDELIDDTKNIDGTTSKVEDNFNNLVLECDGKYYDIELTGWNDGVFDVLIIAEDKDFLFYKKLIKNGEKFGLIGKKYIANMKTLKRSNNVQDNIIKIDRTYFCRKHVFIELACKEGFIKGFFDFCSDDYLDVRVHSFSGLKVQLEFGREIEISNITKLEEL